MYCNEQDGDDDTSDDSEDDDGADNRVRGLGFRV